LRVCSNKLSEKKLYLQTRDSKKPLRSGELAKHAGVSTDLLRHYERIGVLPKAQRSANGYRAYPPEALSRVRAVRRAVALGFTLAELAQFVAVRDRGGVPCRNVRQLASAKLQRVEEALVELQDLREQLRAIVRDWDRRLVNQPAGKRANLLLSLDSADSRRNARPNSRRKGFSRL
jgi:DNA-binding transcriptional MerR regulator